ncbi:hypothetical protein FRB96_005944 [Tulasnella sp. 330]|nr:hypothetical protein FRB96_005944 [Tulasnella sp. 330]KAG8873662.1 hypothetical protein FRB97_006553 [Tulasnella sp. 331]
MDGSPRETRADQRMKLKMMLATQAAVESTQRAVQEMHPVVEATYIGMISIGAQLRVNELDGLDVFVLLPKVDAVFLRTRISEQAPAILLRTPKSNSYGDSKAALLKIERWIERPEYDEKHILWLKAVTGCGKRSVAGTVEKGAKAANRLGARFYFARGKPERNQRAILELSRQLASRPDGQLRASIVVAIKAEPDIAHSTVAYQYQKLIHEPLLTFNHNTSKLVIVLDGVDECEGKYALKLLELVGCDHKQLLLSVKFVTTSRIDRHISCELESLVVSQTVEHLSLDVEGSSSVDTDIALYFKQHLPKLMRPYGIQDGDWP